jgi:hypothetical protein
MGAAYPRKSGPDVIPAFSTYSPIAWAALKCKPIARRLSPLLVELERRLASVLVEVRRLQHSADRQPNPRVQIDLQNRAVAVRDQVVPAGIPISCRARVAECAFLSPRMTAESRGTN